MRGRYELVVVRHGRTAWNAAGKYQGHTDVPLDETGRLQAGAIARELAGIDFDYAVASDLTRARETAEIVLAGRGLALATDARWRELNFGAWEGLTRAQVVAGTPALQRSPASRFVTPEGGESFSELGVRVAAALAEVATHTRRNGRAFVATHAGPLHALLRELLGEAESAALSVTFSPASITQLRIAPEGVTLLDLNRTVG